MPSGIVHEAVECTFLPLFIGGAMYVDSHYLAFPGHLYYLFGASYLFSVFYLSPDLDLNRCRAKKNWGPLAFIWWPYSRLFKHRGLSHAPLLGTITRVAYLFLVGTLIWMALEFLMDWRWAPGQTTEEMVTSYFREMIALGLGLSLPNFLHILLDRLF